MKYGLTMVGRPGCTTGDRPNKKKKKTTTQGNSLNMYLKATIATKSWKGLQIKHDLV